MVHINKIILVRGDSAIAGVPCFITLAGAHKLAQFRKVINYKLRKAGLSADLAYTETDGDS